MKLPLIVIISLTLISLAMIGCSALKGPASPIVQKAEACGSGPLTGSSSEAVQEWFGKHRDCAVAVDSMCKPVRANAAAQWSDSTEGRVCLAARNVAQWMRKPSGDHEKFQSGWK
jgi:hypothetical protein